MADWPTAFSSATTSIPRPDYASVSENREAESDHDIIRSSVTTSGNRRCRWEDSVLDGVMIPAAGRGGAAEFPFYLCSIRHDDFTLALTCVVSGISRGSIERGNS